MICFDHGQDLTLMGSLINGDETEKGSAKLELNFLPCLLDFKTNTCTNNTLNGTTKWLLGEGD